MSLFFTLDANLQPIGRTQALEEMQNELAQVSWTPG